MLESCWKKRSFAAENDVLRNAFENLVTNCNYMQNPAYETEKWENPDASQIGEFLDEVDILTARYRPFYEETLSDLPTEQNWGQKLSQIDVDSIEVEYQRNVFEEDGEEVAEFCVTFSYEVPIDHLEHVEGVETEYFLEAFHITGMQEPDLEPNFEK